MLYMTVTQVIKYDKSVTSVIITVTQSDNTEKVIEGSRINNII